MGSVAIGALQAVVSQKVLFLLALVPVAAEVTAQADIFLGSSQQGTGRRSMGVMAIQAGAGLVQVMLVGFALENILMTFKADGLDIGCQRIFARGRRGHVAGGAFSRLEGGMLIRH